jgi:uncharacterized membrane protein
LSALFLTTFWEVVAWMAIVWFAMMVIWMFIAIFGDIFRRRDLSGIAKAGWIFLIFIVPLFGVLIYLIARPHDATAEQDAEILAAQRRAAGFSPTEEIANAQRLLTSGAITQEEFEAIKARAMA